MKNIYIQKYYDNKRLRQGFLKHCTALLLLTFMLLFSLTVISGHAQDNKEFNDRIKSKRIAFFTDQLQLTPSEAQKFWPLFNEYELKKNALTAEKKKLTDTYTSSPNLNEVETDKIINQYVALNKQEALLFETYNKQFRSFLSARKVMKLYIAETQFKLQLLRELKGNSK